MRTLTVFVLALAVAPVAAIAQDRTALDIAERNFMEDRHALVALGEARGVLFPPDSVLTSPLFGMSVTVYGIYEPTAFPTDSWLRIVCAPADPREVHDEDEHGFDLVRLHVALYDDDSEEIWDSSESTETLASAICDISDAVDSSFFEFPRTLEPAWAFVWVSPLTTQDVELVEITYRPLVVR